jgi:signal transduction histidine kinase/DNA-binding response OmpR family regulator
MESIDKVNILIVDDLPEKLLSLEAILESLGQNIVTAQSGREALRRLLTQDFAVILLDVAMPDMDGFETARLIRQRKRTEHTPIIFITGFSDEMLATQGYALGAVDYILSPVVPDVLRTKVGVFVDLFNKTEQLKRQAEERVALAREQAARAAAEAATRRSAFLAEAATTLNNSLDYLETVRCLPPLVVPFLADLAAVCVLPAPERPGHTELCWAGAGGRHECRSLPGPESLPDGLSGAVAKALATGKAQVLTEVPPGPTPPGEPGWRVSAVAALPLVARGRTLGVLALGLGPSGRRFGPDDLSLAEDLAGRAAIAIDNAGLYHDIQEGDRRKSEFLAMLGHELRNPLAPIRSAVEVLRRQGLDHPGLRTARDMIDRQVQLMVRLVDDLLDVARITRGKIQLRKEPVEMAAVAARAVETSRPLIDERRHALTVSVPDEPLWVAGDAARLAQVIANLLNNAAKYTEPGGRIELAVGRDGDCAVVRVRDTGVGLPPETLSSVFDLFTQVDRSLDRAQGGLGIGLTLVRRLVELHGGRVEAHSAGAGQGSEFIVTLPCLTDAPQPAAEPPPARVEAGGPRRVLVVDDNVDGAESLATLLKLLGHEVHVAHDGPAALRATADVRPEVVFLDIGLPGMDGYEVARRLRRPGRNEALLVALTGYGQDEDRRRSREAGFDHHLVKPVDPAVLEELLAGTAVPAPR